MTTSKLVSPSAIAMLVTLVVVLATGSPASAAGPPVPLLASGKPVAWWAVFKFNAAAFPGCGEHATRACTFGGTVQSYNAFGHDIHGAYFKSQGTLDLMREILKGTDRTVLDALGFTKEWHGPRHRECNAECFVAVTPYFSLGFT